MGTDTQPTPQPHATPYTPAGKQLTGNFWAAGKSMHALQTESCPNYEPVVRHCMILSHVTATLIA